MAESREEVFAAALGLPLEARAELGRTLMASLEEEEDALETPELAAEWRGEISRRAREIDGGALEMQRLIEFALDNPHGGAPVDEEVRWVLSRRFPYGVVHRWRDGRVQVPAFAHPRRRPGYWRSRAGGCQRGVVNGRPEWKRA